MGFMAQLSAVDHLALVNVSMPQALFPEFEESMGWSFL